MELEKHITDERTGISYTLCGDYYLPDLKLPEEKSYDLGRFGRAKLRHLRKCHRALLTSLRTSGTLNEYLHSVDDDCEAMFFRLVRQYAEREGVTEQLKAKGIAALYYYYCYELHILVRFPASAPKLSAAMRQDLRKLDRLDA